jgi:hypothetical protein
MNLKLAHLVAIQFGIFIGIVICLVFSRFESARPRTAAEMRERATERAAAVERMPEPADEFADMAKDREELDPAEQLTDQSTPAMPNEYSPEAVEKSMAILTKLYYDQIAPRRTAGSSPANTTVAPSYTEVAPEPAVVQYDDPAPETVAYVQPTQVIVYPQPAQFVVFSHRRRLANRCRPSPPGALASNPHRRPDRGGTQLNGSPAFSPAGPLAVGQHQNTGAPPCSSTQGFTPRGTR